MAIRTDSRNLDSDWTRSFRPASAWRSGQLTLWTMTACALMLPAIFAPTAQSEDEAPPVVPAPQLLVPLPPPPTDEPVAPVVAAPIVVAPVVAPKTVALTAIVAGEKQNARITLADDMTVGQALAAMGIALSPLDRVAPDATAPFAPNMTVRVTRVSIELKTRNIAIPAGVRYQPTTMLAPGTKQTTQYPRAGAREVTEKVWSKDGKETLRKKVSEKVSRAPQPQIVALGVKSHLMPGAIAPHKRYARALSSRGGSPRDRAGSAGSSGDKPGLLKVARTLTMTTTGYAAGRTGGSIGSRTATGVRCTYGAIAVDPRVIPLGSMLYVEGYGYGFACDIGGAIKGNHIDLAFDSARAALNHGKKRGVTVYVLAP